jgi:hypothetical protein
MRPTFKRLEVKDLSNLEKLVTDNIEGIEPGLRVVDSHLVLGQAAIDLVALDASESLVLVALDFVADEGLLLRAMDAYSWCLEYPDTLRRLYPTARVSPTRPPRILFIVERLTDAFVRRLKHLSFLEIDCLEFRHLEVNGAPAVYFDLVERLRRAAPVEPAPDERVVTTTTTRTPKRIERDRPVIESEWPVVAEPKRAQSSLRPPAGRQPAPFAGTPAMATASPGIPERIVSLEARLAELLAEASVEEMPTARETPSAEETPSSVEMPAPDYASDVEPAAASADNGAADSPALRFESVDEAAQQEELDVASVAARVSSNPDWQTLLNQLGVEIPAPTKGMMARAVERADETPTVEPPAAVPVEASVAAVEEDAPTVEEMAPTVEETAPAVEEPAPVTVDPEAPPRTLPAWAKPSANKAVQPAGGRTYFFSQAVKGATAADTKASAPAETPVTSTRAPAQPPPAPAYLRPAAAPAQPSEWPPAPAAAQPAVPESHPAAAAPKPVAPNLSDVSDRPELEALNFPKDGLSRQWLEFLNQLGATK